MISTQAWDVHPHSVSPWFQIPNRNCDWSEVCICKNSTFTVRWLVNHLIGHSQRTKYTLVYGGYSSWTSDLEIGRGMGREDARGMWVSWQTPQIPLLDVFKWENITFLWLISETESIIMAVGRYSTKYQVTHWSYVKVFYPPQLSLPATRPP